jgi:hypothetical protein
MDSIHLEGKLQGQVRDIFRDLSNLYKIQNKKSFFRIVLTYRIIRLVAAAFVFCV